MVKVPDGIPIVRPANLGDLLTQKAQGYLLFYAGFTRVAYDDLLDTSNVDFTTSTGVIAGQRSTIILQPGGVLQSLLTPLTPPTPSQVLVTWDTFNYTTTDPSNDNYSRQYNELPSVPANVTCQVSFDGTTFTTTTDSAILSVPIPQQGTSFIIQLTNASNSRLGIGSWTLIY